MTKRTRLEEDEREDSVGGNHEPFDVLVRMEGGFHNKANVAAAQHYAQECIARGAEWVRYN